MSFVEFCSQIIQGGMDELIKLNDRGIRGTCSLSSDANSTHLRHQTKTKTSTLNSVNTNQGRGGVERPMVLFSQT